MNILQVLEKLRCHEQELRANGVATASLFGSVARDEAGSDSDVDVAVQVSGAFSDGGFDAFWKLQQLERQLSQLLGCKVDVVVEPVRKQHFQNEIDRDRVRAF